MNINTLVAAKMLIIEDMDNQNVPYDVESFADLHDYVDANEYLPQTSAEEGLTEADIEAANTLADGIDAWLKNDGVANVDRCPDCGAAVWYDGNAGDYVHPARSLCFLARQQRCGVSA